MTLTLRAVSLNDHPLTQPITAHFDAEGGSIGRSDHNTLALPDPERHISRQHAEIIVSGGGYLIKNVGSANPIVVLGQALARGQSAPLGHGDQVRIGGYLLEVIHEAADDDQATTVARGRAAVDALNPGIARRTAGPRTSPGAAHAGAGERGTPLSSSNPFANLLGEAMPARPAAPVAESSFNLQPPAAGVPATSAAWAAAGTAPKHQLLPDDFDPFAAPVVAPAPRAPPRSEVGGAFDDLLPSTEPPSIDQLIDLQPGDRDPLADFTADLPLPPRGAGSDASSPSPGLSADPMSMFSDVSDARARAVGISTPADDVPELHAAFMPPAVRAAPAPAPNPPAPNPPAPQAAAAPPRAQPAPRWSGEPHELWGAFCEGAGVSVDPPQGIDPELMRVVGGLLQAAVAGTLQLMMARATTKHELRAQVTMIQARNNNPLKFSPDARSALEQMLQPPMRGFLAGPAAMTDAMQDLLGHTIGTMAGTRAALEGVLDRFRPHELEAKLVGKTMLDSLLPMNRKAKLWELYLHQFEAIRSEAQEDFHTLFGRAFLAAYEQQLDRLKRGALGQV